MFEISLDFNEGNIEEDTIYSFVRKVEELSENPFIGMYILDDEIEREFGLEIDAKWVDELSTAQLIIKLNRIIKENYYVNDVSKVTEENLLTFLENELLLDTSIIREMRAFDFWRKILSENSPVENPTNYDLFACFFDYYKVDVYEEDINRINSLTSITDLLRMIKEKVRNLKPNNCSIVYGKRWPNTLRSKTQKKLGEFTQSPEFHTGATLPMQHIGSHWSGGFLEKGDLANRIFQIRFREKKVVLFVSYTSIDELLKCGWAVN